MLAAAAEGVLAPGAKVERFAGGFKFTEGPAADKDGNVICLTQSLGAGFGGGVVIPGTGVCSNNFLYWGEINPKGTNYMRPGGPLALPMAPSVVGTW